MDSSTSRFGSGHTSSSVIETHGTRILCLAEIRGNLTKINTLAAQHHADVVIHTGNFGFFDEGSVSRIHDSYLRHIAAFACTVSPQVLAKVNELSRIGLDKDRHGSASFTGANNELKKALAGSSLSELPLFISKTKQFDIPVYTVYGMAEDSVVVNKFRSGEYQVPNLHLIDECSVQTVKTKCGLPVCLFGLGGTLLKHKLFHHGATEIVTRGSTMSAGGDPGNMWITALQIGQLIKTVNSSFARDAVRIFVTHPSPCREPLLGQLAILLRADYTLSNSLHFIYPSSFNELSVNPTFDHYKQKLADARAEFTTVWQAVREPVAKLLARDAGLKQLMALALDAFDRIPTVVRGTPEPLSLADPAEAAPSVVADVATFRKESDNHYLAFQNMWHLNLGDVQSSVLTLDVANNRLQLEVSSVGFDFSHRVSGHHVTGGGSAGGSAEALRLNRKANGDRKGESDTKSAPGVWVSNANGLSGTTEEQHEKIKQYFHEEDRVNIREVAIKSYSSSISSGSTTDKNGNVVAASPRKFALVYFRDLASAEAALPRVDLEKAKKVALIDENTASGNRNRKFGSRGRGSGGPRTRGRGPR